MTFRKKLSVVITTRNRKDILLRLIDSLKKSTYQDFELIVIDDCSTDGTQTLASDNLQFRDARIIHGDTPLMMVKARNCGARESNGEYVLFIDDDNVVDAKMLEELVRCADKHNDYGIIGPSIYFFSDGKLRISYQKISFWTGGTKGLVGREGREMYESDGIPNSFLIKKKLFNEYGYFDEDLVQTFTEPDFAFTVRKHGWKCGMCSRAIIYHDAEKHGAFSPRSMGGQFIQKAYFVMRNRSLMIKRYGTAPQKFVYTIFFSWMWPSVYSLIMLKYQRWDLIRLYWLGFWDGMMYMLFGKLINSFVNEKL